MNASNNAWREIEAFRQRCSGSANDGRSASSANYESGLRIATVKTI